MDQHDDGRIRAREMLGLAVRVDTFPHMAAVAGLAWASAPAAEPVRLVPVGQCLHIGQQPAVLAWQLKPRFPDIREFALAAKLRQVQRIVHV